MALVSRNAGDQIRSLDVDQYYQALIGTMADQPYTLANQLSVTGRSIVWNTLTSPTIASYSITGATGATTWFYEVVAVNSDGNAVPGPAYSSVTNANATLSSSNYVNLNFPPATGATSYIILRCATVNGTYTNVGTVAGVQGQTANYTFQDKSSATGSAFTVPTVGPGGFQFAKNTASDIGSDYTFTNASAAEIHSSMRCTIMVGASGRVRADVAAQVVQTGTQDVTLYVQVLSGSWVKVTAWPGGATPVTPMYGSVILSGLTPGATTFAAGISTSGGTVTMNTHGRTAARDGTYLQVASSL